MDEFNNVTQNTQTDSSNLNTDTVIEQSNNIPLPDNTVNTVDYQPAPTTQELPYVAPQQPVQTVAKKENIVAGIVGSFLFSLVGGLLYFIIYQFGFIAGICGLVTVVLAGKGYQKFSGSDSLKGVIISIIISVIVIFLSEYLCISYEIYEVYKEFDITFFDAVRSTPEFLTDSEVLGAMVKDLLISYALGIIAAFGTIRQSLSGRK